MLSSNPWLVLLPAHAVGAGAPPVPARLQGEDLVVWRTAAGALQVWRDRCPHRGVRLSLGRVQGDRLACAYHGWEFDAGSGRCVAIPALADLTRVPGDVHAGVRDACESAGMVWVRTGTDAPDNRTPGAGPPADGVPHFMRSLVLRTPLAALHAHLHAQGFATPAPCVWQGRLAAQPVRLFTQDLQPDLAGVHAWLDGPAPPAALVQTLAALHRLRSDAESGSS